MVLALFPIVPDNDLVPRLLPRHWRRPFQAALDRASAAEVGDEIRAATAAALRDAGGCPELEQLAYAARYVAVFGDLPAWEQAQRRFLDINGRNVLSQTMAREAEHLLARDRDGLAAMSDGEACRQITEGGLSRWVDERMWGRGRDLLLEQYGDFDEARRFEAAANAHASLDELADRLLRKPDGDGLRAPDRKIRPRDTQSLLYEDLS
ncbi:hypothetical protein [Paraconexibacter algicola]|uniref:Uncharacterized protein n=1 Tax=Paraconexibacter algicola TaxID=2133960 RepID=A0A2T4UH75_9ACTN|nr:hypothetical protein [Paraconexibacter algicola]PTL58603.1 hypothetical protein C7Y72_02480 [Paraconexibacter algicola]